MIEPLPNPQYVNGVAVYVIPLIKIAGQDRLVVNNDVYPYHYLDDLRAAIRASGEPYLEEPTGKLLDMASRILKDSQVSHMVVGDVDIVFAHTMINGQPWYYVDFTSLTVDPRPQRTPEQIAARAKERAECDTKRRAKEHSLKVEAELFRLWEMRRHKLPADTFMVFQYANCFLYELSGWLSREVIPWSSGKGYEEYATLLAKVQIASMTAKQLREALASHGIKPKSGEKKPEMMHRLWALPLADKQAIIDRCFPNWQQ